MKRYEFTNRSCAFSFVDHAIKPLWVILGDNGRFWVVRPSDAARLLRVGYELAK